VATSCDSAFCEVQLWPAAGTLHSPALVTALAQQVAACDFQWAGWGLGIQDVVYLLWTSVQPEVLQAQEELLLEWYRGALDVELRSRGFSGAPPANMLQAHYQVCGFMHHVRRFLGWSLLSFAPPIQSELCTQHCARSIRSGIYPTATIFCSGKRTLCKVPGSQHVLHYCAEVHSPQNSLK
jgi:hypothetical protein